MEVPVVSRGRAYC